MATHNTSGKLRIAVTGVGWVTTHRHIPSLRTPPDVEVEGIVDGYEGRAQEASRKLQAPPGGRRNSDWRT